jgi:sugar/nucleoside kinase (ribokinase family)
MIVKMLSIAAGPDWQASPDQVVDRPFEEAQALVIGGYALTTNPADEAAVRKPAKPAKDA